MMVPESPTAAAKTSSAKLIEFIFLLIPLCTLVIEVNLYLLSSGLKSDLILYFLNLSSPSFFRSVLTCEKTKNESAMITSINPTNADTENNLYFFDLGFTFSK